MTSAAAAVIYIAGSPAVNPADKNPYDTDCCGNAADSQYFFCTARPAKS